MDYSVDLKDFKPQTLYDLGADFTGRRDLRAFAELCAKHGLFVILRIGPFAHGEVRNGGLPDWLFGKPFEVRSLDAGLALLR